jgi:hypothetical protein
VSDLRFRLNIIKSHVHLVFSENQSETKHQRSVMHGSSRLSDKTFALICHNNDLIDLPYIK